MLHFFFLCYIYLTRKCLIEIKHLLYKRILAQTAAVAHYTKFQTIQHCDRQYKNVNNKDFCLDHE